MCGDTRGALLAAVKEAAGWCWVASLRKLRLHLAVGVAEAFLHANVAKALRNALRSAEAGTSKVPTFMVAAKAVEATTLRRYGWGVLVVTLLREGAEVDDESLLVWVQLWVGLSSEVRTKLHLVDMMRLLMTMLPMKMQQMTQLTRRRWRCCR